MDQKNIRLTLRKYESNIQSIWMELTNDMLNLLQLHIDFQLCSIPVNIKVQLKDGTIIDVDGFVNENLDLFKIIGDYGNGHEMYQVNQFDDSCLCALQDTAIKIWK